MDDCFYHTFVVLVILPGVSCPTTIMVPGYHLVVWVSPCVICVIHPVSAIHLYVTTSYLCKLVSSFANCDLVESISLHGSCVSRTCMYFLSLVSTYVLQLVCS